MKYFDEEDAITEYEKQLQKKDNEIERLKEEYIILQNASDEVEEEKDREIERLHSIIKEVREIFKDYGEKEDIVGYTMYNITGEMLLKLLEILDKAGDEK